MLVVGTSKLLWETTETVGRVMQTTLEQNPASDGKPEGLEYESVESPHERESVFTRLARLDADWDTERRAYMLRNRRGYWRVPHHAMSVVWTALGIALAGLWVPLLISAISGRDWHLVHVAVPAVSAIFVINGLYTFRLAVRYERALEHYQRARADLLARHERGN
jgi:hypothetical protein